MLYDNPSFYAHIINGLLLLTAFVVLSRNYKTLRDAEPYKLVMLILVLSLAIGLHGLSHMGLEKIYNYNPIEDIKRML